MRFLKAILFLIALCLLCSIGYGQSTPNWGSANALQNNLGGAALAKWLKIPSDTLDITSTLISKNYQLAAKAGILYLRDTAQGKWVAVGTATDSGIFVTNTILHDSLDGIRGFTPQDSVATIDIRSIGYAFQPYINQFASGKFLIMYRLDSTHLLGESHVVYRTCDDGQGIIWSDIIDTLFVSPRIADITTGMGYNNRLIAAITNRGAVSTDTSRIFVKYSDDEGVSFEDSVHVPTPDTTLWAIVYGNVIKIGGNKLLLSWYTGGAYDTLWGTYINTSDDNGLTWGEAISVKHASPADTANYSEASYAYLGNNTIVGMIRDDHAGLFKQVKSIDNGLTWTDMGYVYNIDSFASNTGNGGMPNLQTFVHPSGRRMVACYYASRQSSGTKAVKVAYGYATDILSSVNGWSSQSRTAIFSVLTSLQANYPTVIHINNQIGGIGVASIDSPADETKGYLRIFYTPTRLPLINVGNLALRPNSNFNFLPELKRIPTLDIMASANTAGAPSVTIGATINSPIGSRLNNTTKTGIIAAVAYNNDNIPPYSGIVFSGTNTAHFVDIGGGTVNFPTATNVRLITDTGLNTRTGGVTYLSVTGREGLRFPNSISGVSADSLVVSDLDSGIIRKAAPLSAALSGYITAVTGDAPVVSSGGSTPAISMPVATSSVDGYLDNADWTTFNTKESALTFSTGLTRTTNTITNNLSTGVSGGQSINGGTGASEDLSINPTTNGTTTTSTVAISPSGGDMSFGSTSSHLSGVATAKTFTLTNTAERSIIEYWRNSNTITDNGAIGQFDFYAGTTPAQIAAIVGLQSGTAENAGKLVFYTANGSGGVAHLLLNQAGNLGLGLGVTDPSAKFHVVSTTEQQRTAYDASNYLSTTISSTGNATLNLTASSGTPRFTFSDDVISTKYYVSTLNTPPANATATGTQGEIRFGSDGYLYLCTATNVWVRVQLSTW